MRSSCKLGGAAIPPLVGYVSGLTSYVFAWLNNTMTYTVEGTCAAPPRFGRCEPTSWSIGVTQSALLISVITAATLAAAVLALRRRDVT